MSKTVNDHIKKEKKNYFILIVPVLLIVVVILFQRIYPEREALNGLKGDYLIITETVYDNEYKLFSLEQKLELDEKNIRVYDEQYRLVRKITKYSFSDELRIINYRYSGRKVYISYHNSNDEHSLSLDGFLDKALIEIQPVRDSILFGELFIWDADAYPLNGQKYQFENNRYQVEGPREPYPVTIVYYNGYGYPDRRTKYWSRQYINNHDGLHEEFRYEYDADQRLTKVSEYKDSSWTKDWLLQVVRTFEYQNKTL
jgi:hypothetical protein